MFFLSCNTQRTTETFFYLVNNLLCICLTHINLWPAAGIKNFGQAFKTNA